jgi:hypothetical protein
MRLPRTPAFDEESARFALKFCCEDCGNFDAERESCRHFWPTELHRRAASSVGELVFCKEFELC